MTVFYRLCNIKSENSKKSPILSDNLFELNKLCLKSFVEAFKEVNPIMIFICDYCPIAEYSALIKEVVPFKKETHFTELGINGTCLMQYELARECDDTVLFQECDYLYVPGTGKTLLKAIETFGLVSPYDHLNFYKDRSIHSNKCEIELLDNTHFRMAERNTMTFGMTQQALQDNYDSLKRWGYLDNEVWKEMRVKGYKLWVPIPSFATHMVEGYLAPSIDWKTLWLTQI